LFTLLFMFCIHSFARRRALASLALVCSAAGAWAQSPSPSSPDDERAYLTVQADRLLSPRTSGPDIAMGGPVVLHGRSELGSGHGYGLALGREYRRERDDQTYRHTRYELEYWRGSVQRDSLSVSSIRLNPHDRLDAQALTLNALLRVGTTEHTRWWLGAGLGHGQVKYPDLAGSIPGCKCLGPANASGLAWRVKLLAERQIGTDSALFLQWGHLGLPAGATTGVPTTRYGKLGANEVALGLRVRF
jgi:opacity protein-like surface antigen